MKENPSVAIVILNWNTRNYLKRFLPSVLAATYPNKQVYVIDNKSTDDSVQMLRTEFPGVITIEMPENNGFASGYNFGLSTIKADYYLLMNSDLEVTPGFMEPAIRLLESNPDYAICQPKLLALDNKNMFEYAGAAGGWIDRLGYPFSRGRVLLTIEEDKGQYDDLAEVFWASGACMFVKSAVFEKIGGFYDYYYMHQEDIDLCWRAQNQGFRIFACPESVVYHIGGGTLSWENHLKTFLTFRNNYILLCRNLALVQLVPVLFLRIGLDLAGCIYFLFKREAGISRSMFHAIFAFFYWLLFSGAKFHKQPRGFRKRTGIYQNTIIIPYFLGKRKFSDYIPNPKIKNRVSEVSHY